jgi:signal transduction histidine kinase
VNESIWTVRPGPSGWPARGQRALSVVTALACVIGLGVTLIWAAAGGGYYWPRWVWLAGLACIAPIVWFVHATSLTAGRRRAFVIHAEVDLTICGYLILVWVFAGSGVFWPVWTLLSAAVALALHALIAFRHQLPPRARNRQLTKRVETLTRTRRGALDVQAAQLRRIERDLHDGAQARLVSLSMQLGRAEARLANDPEAAALVKAAREEARAAITELRDLARGIAPPVLTDRGLAAAVQSLADRSALRVVVNAEQLGERPPPVVETAVYFVVAEALTNAAKHAHGSDARVTLTRRGPWLLIDVADDGPGGADPEGSGLDGLRARVEALDGHLAVASPVGGPTIIHAELPCES